MQEGEMTAQRTKETANSERESVIYRKKQCVACCWSTVLYSTYVARILKAIHNLNPIPTSTCHPGILLGRTAHDITLLRKAYTMACIPPLLWTTSMTITTCRHLSLQHLRALTAISAYPETDWIYSILCVLKTGSHLALKLPHYLLDNNQDALGSIIYSGRHRTDNLTRTIESCNFIH
jgi:hypothetical protein